MNPREQNMQGFLSRAASIIAKTDAMSPIPQKNIPTLAESAGELGIIDYQQSAYQQPTYQQPTYQQPIYQQPNNGYTQPGSKLPSSILESLKTNPIQEYNSTAGISVLDNFMPMPNQRVQVNEDYASEKQMPTTEEMLMKSRALRENGNTKQSYQQPMQNNGGVDYSLIRAIISECVSNEIKELKKTLQEGSVIMTVGNNVKFVTKTGAVFEGKMKKTGQIDM